MISNPTGNVFEARDEPRAARLERVRDSTSAHVVVNSFWINHMDLR